MKLLTTLALLLVVSGGLCLPSQPDSTESLEQETTTTTPAVEEIAYTTSFPLEDDLLDPEEVERVNYLLHKLLSTMLESPNITHYVVDHPEKLNVSSTQVADLVAQELSCNTELIEIVDNILEQVRQNPQSAQLWKDVAAEFARSTQILEEEGNSTEEGRSSALLHTFLGSFANALLAGIVGMIISSIG